MSNIREEHGKPRLHVSVTLLFGIWLHVARLHRRRRAYAATSNTAVHDNHEKIRTGVSFSCMVMGLRLATFRAAGAPL